LDTRCELCQAPCLTCRNLTSCLSCIEKFYLLNDQCVEKCPNGYYLYNKQCFECNPMCGICTGKQ
jgi:proprotein convertase subtilisin/kexin type 5